MYLKKYWTQANVSLGKITPSGSGLRKQLIIPRAALHAGSYYLSNRTDDTEILQPHDLFTLRASAEEFVKAVLCTVDQQVIYERDLHRKRVSKMLISFEKDVDLWSEILKRYKGLVKTYRIIQCLICFTVRRLGRAQHKFDSNSHRFMYI